MLMFCKTTKSKIYSGNLKKLTFWIKEKWGPLISSQEGFKGSYFIVKPSGEFVIIMLWQTESQIQSWTDNPEHKALVPEFMSLTEAEVSMDIYEVKEVIEA